MECTAPINIVKNVGNKCDKKCKYLFKYPRTNLVATNRTKYIEFKCEQTTEAPAIYNNVKYNVTELRLYSPSLHTYGDQHAIGELIIQHTDTTSNKKVFVCIPIQIGTALMGKEKILGDIVKDVLREAPNTNETTTIKIDTFTLNNIVPKKPFYTYQGTLPYNNTSCTEETIDYVIFDTVDAIVITQPIYEALKQVITVNNITTKTPTSELYYNKDGPGALGEDEDDNIYINCEPTTDIGGEPPTSTTVALSTDSDVDPKFSIKTIKAFLFDSPFGLFFIGLIIMTIIIFVWKAVAKKVQSLGGEEAAG